MTKATQEMYQCGVCGNLLSVKSDRIRRHISQAHPNSKNKHINRVVVDIEKWILGKGGVKDDISSK